MLQDHSTHLPAVSYHTNNKVELHTKTTDGSLTLSSSAQPPHRFLFSQRLDIYPQKPLVGGVTDGVVLQDGGGGDGQRTGMLLVNGLAWLGGGSPPVVDPHSSHVGYRMSPGDTETEPV